VIVLPNSFILPLFFDQNSDLLVVQSLCRHVPSVRPCAAPQGKCSGKKAGNTSRPPQHAEEKLAVGKEGE